MSLSTPVVLIIFNRPQRTKKVLAEIAKAKPRQLFIIADGPRNDVSEDIEKCQETQALIDTIDWECQVYKNYAEQNLGCGYRVATGLNWVFEQVEEAIILEDDCLPHPTFFQFCHELLQQYKHDTRIMMICGTNHMHQWKMERQSYHFSYYGGIWGWASWKRAWKFFDYTLSLWQYEEVKNRIRDIFFDEEQFFVRAKAFSETRTKIVAGEPVTWWSYQWSFARLSQSGLSIVPSVNLISNIGIGPNATHTWGKMDVSTELYQNGIAFPLVPPLTLVVDREYDDYFYQKIFKGTPPPFPLEEQHLFVRGKKLLKTSLYWVKNHYYSINR